MQIFKRKGFAGLFLVFRVLSYSVNPKSGPV